jgi:23S rRNA (cytosine1962-C5)-methyltransferase
MNAKVILQPRRARPFYGRHPWVYAGAVAEVRGEPADGDEVELLSHAGNFIAHGLYNSKSKIRVRLYSWSQETPLNTEFFRARLDQAIQLRDFLGLNRASAACRLVFSEGDGLSGLTVDRYDSWLVVQFTSLGMALRREMWAELLTERLKPEGIYLRTERGIGKLEGLELQDGPLRGEVLAGPIEIEENGLRFLVNIAEGQKTGFYLDQRDNRQAVARLTSRGTEAPVLPPPPASGGEGMGVRGVGRRVLDAFCYTGGFGLYAARAGAREVLCVDSSESALNLAWANARLNDLANISFIQADVFDHLAAILQEGQRFGLIILDPPKFARSRNAVEEALRGYRRLQTLALRLLETDGFLVTCCCSGLITMSMLDDLLAQLAAEERRTVQVLERRGQSLDHPVSVACPESNYLKCLISRVV